MRTMPTMTVRSFPAKMPFTSRDGQDVYERECGHRFAFDGRLPNVEARLQRKTSQPCSHCGATSNKEDTT